MLRTPRQRYARLLLISALLAALVLAGPAAPVVGAATFTVDRGDDPDPPAQTCTTAANDCSLRGALLAANANPDADTISLSAGTYTLSIGGDDDAAQVGDLDITESVAIVGASASTAIIDADGIDRVFDIVGGSVTIANLTIRGGLAPASGGAIYNRFGSSLTLADSILDGNAAPSGAGIYNIGTLALAESTIVGNLAGFGAGIYNTGTLRVSASAIISNTANTTLAPTGGVGGGVYNNGVPGGAAALTITNSTISGNRATLHGAGVYNIQGAVNLNNATIAKNIADSDANATGQGGGIIHISGPGSVSIRNTIVAGNVAASAPDCSGTLESQGYNLIQAPAGCALGAGAGDITGQDPKLSPLRNNGGPTRTQALLVGSPAIDAGNPNGCKDDLGNSLATDQRGFPRPQGGRCDIGAYERSAGLPPPAIEKAFVPATILVGRSATLVFTITNVATATISGLAFSDPMPAAIKVANPPNVSTTCSGTLSAPIGASTIGLIGGGLAANGTCTIHVSVTSATAGSHANTAGPASATETGAGGPSNTATLMVEQPSYRILLPMVRR
jgi:hypothetical protein